jgi:hypothetical protein
MSIKINVKTVIRIVIGPIVDKKLVDVDEETI